MVRRASSRISLSTVLLAGGLVLLAVGAGYYFVNGLGNPYRTLQALDLPAYLENANSLRGNTYRIDGTIENALAWSPAKGRLISVDIGASDESGPKTGIVAIFIPTEFNHINLQKGQRYQFKVEIGKDGLIEASDLHKS